MAARRFYEREGKTWAESTWKIAMFTSYRACRWLYMHLYVSRLGISYFLLPFIAFVLYILA